MSKYDYQEFTHSYVALGDGFAVKRKGADSNMVILVALKRDACGEIAVSTYKSYQIERL